MSTPPPLLEVTEPMILVMELFLLVLLITKVLPFIARTLFRHQALGSILVVSASAAFIHFILPQQDLSLENVSKQNQPVKKYTIAAEYKSDGSMVASKLNIPVPSNTEMLVRINTTSLNPVDYKINRAKAPLFRWIVPHTIVYDFSGVVVSRGKYCSDFEIGDEVFGASVKGALGEYALAYCLNVAKKPKGLSFEDAASLPTISVGYQGLQSLLQGKNNKEKSLLVIGASGGCGLFVLELAKVWGVGKVIAISSEKNKDLVLQSGATDFIDYNAKDFLKQIEALKGKVDIVYDAVSSFEDFDYYPTVHQVLKVTGAKVPHYIGINGLYSDWIRKFMTIGTFNLINFQKPDYDLYIVFPGGYIFSEIAELAVKPGVNLVPKKAAVFEDLTTETINAGFKLLKSRRTIGKILYKFKA